jgi:hydroxymethylglutaryl-CoA lyase
MHTHRKVNHTSFEKTCKNANIDIKPIIFDVSLRDGLQSANPKEYTTLKKYEILHAIHHKFSPAKMEIGAFVSPKILPIMGDTSILFDLVQSHVKDSTDIYALVPNKIGLLTAINSGFTNFSFVTSVSNAFQVKNTGRNLIYKKSELDEMVKYIKLLKMPVKTKLYISCITECPVTGPVNSDFIIHEIISSYGLVDEYDELCISDTMGTLKCKDFEYIVDNLIRFGVTPSRISIHLHINSENEIEAKQILFACFRRKINQFDVSIISEGGCSVTMNPEQLKPNMTYDFLYSALEEYKLLESNLL